MNTGFGIDIGGTAIKGAPINLDNGEVLAEPLTLPTPSPSTPAAVAEVTAQIVGSFSQSRDAASVGVAFPAIMQQGIARSAANVDKSWIGTDVSALMSQSLGRPVTALNDADAAGLAEARWGAARGVSGVVLVITLGTGIGSALLNDSRLVPNTELGHLEIDGFDAEDRAANSARENESLSWEEWAMRLQRYFDTVERLFTPDLIVVGGGVIAVHEKFLPLLKLKTPMVPAALGNNAGIAGAAIMATERL